MRIVRLLLPALMFGAFVAAAPAYAQYDIPSFNLSDYSLPNTSSSIVLIMDPQHPQPGDTVHVSAQSVFLDLPHMNITWTVGGEVVAQGIGVTSAAFIAGPLGSVTTVQIDAASASGSGSKSLTFVPTVVDLLYESDSYVPPFFTGRALPSVGSEVRVQALPFFRRANGSYISNDSIYFTWSRNGVADPSLSGVGKSAAVFSSPSLYGADSISVQAAATDNSQTGEATVRVPSVTPILTIYQEHPLFGEMYYSALDPQTYLKDTEMTFAAVPYFAPAASPDDPSLQYDWIVNGKSIAPDPAKPSKLTVHADPGSPAARIHLDIEMSNSLMFGMSGDWTVSLGASTVRSSGTNSTAGNPFVPQ